MKCLNDKIYIIAMIALFLMSNTTLAEVYKIVDKNGNVSYTDQKPKDGSAPIKLKPISVVESPGYEKPMTAKGIDGNAAQSNEMSIKTLRRHYADFAIVAPQAEASIWQPEAPVMLAWATKNPLQDGMQVTVILDGDELAPTRAPSVKLPDLDRGQHNVSAQLKDAKNRIVATADEVVFFIRRPNIYSNRPRPVPHGGG